MDNDLQIFIGHRFTQHYKDDFRNALNESFKEVSTPLKPVYADSSLVSAKFLIIK